MSSYARTEDEISKKFFHRELAGGLNWEKMYELYRGRLYHLSELVCGIDTDHPSRTGSVSPATGLSVRQN